MTAGAAPHVPVLMDEVIAALAIREGETHVDGTFGAGGYSRAMVAAGAKVVAFDRDPDAIRAGNAAMYYPESNILVPRDTDPHSGTPSFKAVTVSVTLD